MEIKAHYFRLSTLLTRVCFLIFCNSISLLLIARCVTYSRLVTVVRHVYALCCCSSTYLTPTLIPIFLRTVSSEFLTQLLCFTRRTYLKHICFSHDYLWEVRRSNTNANCISRDGRNQTALEHLMRVAHYLNATSRWSRRGRDTALGSPHPTLKNLVPPIGNDPISRAFQTRANPSQLKRHCKTWRKVWELNPRDLSVHLHSKQWQ